MADLSSLSDQELNFLDQIHGKPMHDMSNNDLNFLDAIHMKMDAAAEKPGAADYVSAAVKTPLEAIGKASQGLRGIGVGAANAITGGDVLNRAAEATKPGFKPEGIAETIGGIAGETAPLLALPGIAAPAIAMGATSAGESLNKGEPLSTAATKGAITGVTAAALGKATELALPVLQSAYRSTIGAVKGVGRKVVDLAFDAAKDAAPTVQQAAGKFFDELKNLSNIASEKLTAAEAMPEGIVNPHDVAKSAAEFAQHIKDQTFAESEAAANLLNPDKTLPIKSLLDQVNAAKDELLSKRVLGGTDSTTAYRTLNRWARAIEGAGRPPARTSTVLEPFVTPPTAAGGEIAEPDVKKVLKTIADDAGWKDVAGTGSEKVLRDLYHRVAGTLAKANPAYGEAIAPISAKIEALDAFNKSLGLETTKHGVILPTDRTATSLMSISRGGKGVSGDLVGNLGFKGGQSLEKATAEAAAKKTAMKEATAAQPAISSLGDIRALAESAARAGRGSPQALKLAETLDVVMPGQGATLAQQLMESGANELLTRGHAPDSLGMSDILTSAVQGLKGKTNGPKKIDALITALKSPARKAATVVGGSAARLATQEN